VITNIHRPGRCPEIPEILKFVLKCPEIHFMSWISYTCPEICQNSRKLWQQCMYRSLL